MAYGEGEPPVTGRPGDSQKSPGRPATGGGAPRGHSYENSQRSQQAAATRERIVAAATEMVHGLPDWGWRDLTIRAVARHAGVHESTVYRHFATERNLRDAVLRRLETEAGVEVDDLRLDTFADVIGRTFSYLATFPITREPTKDPTVVALDQRRRDALRAAVAASAPDWTDDELEMTAAALDAYWNVRVFERMITTWDLDADQAIRAATWFIDLIAAAVRDGRRPNAASNKRPQLPG